MLLRQQEMNGGRPPDAAAMRQVLRAYATMRPPKPDHAQRMLQRMLEHGLEPGLVSYSLLIESFSHVHPMRPADAERLLGPAQQAQRVDKAQPLELVRDMFVSVIRAYARSVPSRPEEAERMLGSMQQAKLKAHCATFTLVAVAYASAEPARPEDAERLLGLMKSSGVKPDGAMHGAVIRAFSSAQPPRPQEARRALDKAGKVAAAASYVDVATAFANAQPAAQPEESEGVLRDMRKAKDMPRDDPAYGEALGQAHCVVVAAYISAQPPRLEDAERVMAAMRAACASGEAAAGLSMATADVQATVTMLIEALASAKPSRAVDAERVLLRMTEAGVSVGDTYVHCPPSMCSYQDRHIYVMLSASSSRGTVIRTSVYQHSRRRYTLVVQAYAQAQPPLPEEAERVLVGMAKAGVGAELAAYDACVDAYIQSLPTRPA